MKRIWIVFLAAMLLFSAAACSSDKGGAADKDAVDNGDFDEIDAAKLPSKIDLRDYDGKNYVTPVKSQQYGDCWAFAQAAAAETSYLFANEMGVPAGEINDQVDFSEKYIAWYMFHGITGDDVAVGKVRASQVGEGFDLSEAEKNMDVAAYIIGGKYIDRANLFGSGFGPVDESVSVKGETPYAYDDMSEVEWKLPLNAEYRNAPTQAVFRNSCSLPSPAGKDENGGYAFNEDGLNAIKSEISQGHTVTFGLRSMHPGFNIKNKTVYYDGDESPDHAVAVVGYDDDYAKENFARTDSGDKVIEGTTPPENGAFIIKNSWGLADNDDDGFLYLSYYDHSITTPMSYEFDKSDSAGATALNYDQYDLMMTAWYGSTDYDEETKTANVFDAEEDESLCQIEYTTGSEKTEVSYEIYKGVEADDPASGEMLEKGVSRHLYPGCHRIDLEDEYALKKGDRYAVVLTMKRVADEDGEMVYTEVFPYSAPFFNGMAVSGVINEGESYLYTDGKWVDMTNLKEDLIERAYQQGKDNFDEEEEGLYITPKGKEDYTVDNYPIKAILKTHK